MLILYNYSTSAGELINLFLIKCSQYYSNNNFTQSSQKKNQLGIQLMRISFESISNVSKKSQQIYKKTIL